MSKLQESQRALLLQGGGSLGAYEAVVYQAAYGRITKKDIERGTRDGPVLDFVAGTSIVAINTAIIVSYVVGGDTGWAPQKD
jgi:NTE family protein